MGGLIWCLQMIVWLCFVLCGRGARAEETFCPTTGVNKTSAAEQLWAHCTKECASLKPLLCDVDAAHVYYNNTKMVSSVRCRDW